MDLSWKDIPEGSELLRGFNKELNASDIDLVLVLANLGGGVCEIWGAKGELSNETNIEIGLHAFLRGYRVLQFHALKGKQVSRWAELIGSDDTFDYYRVDLISAVDQLNKYP